MSRLPQLLSPHLFLDGDEAVIGLMARHVADGRALPLFFYGQNYGLALFEAGAGDAGLSRRRCQRGVPQARHSPSGASGSARCSSA
ncbi:MAG: hypothetical protein R2712_01585 [Vicinamibacterales bacterium]